MLLSLFFSSQINAFTLSNSGRVAFPSSDVSILIAANTCSQAGFNSASELRSMVEESINSYWNKIPTCALKLEVEGFSSVDTSSMTLLQTLQNTPVGKILVGCSDDTDLFASSGSGDSGILGVGSINTASGDRGAFLINNYDTSFANLDHSEKIATIAHELGHAFGLGHSSDPAALMYYAVGNKIQTNLSIDDYDGCSWLYPHDSPTSCGSVSYISDDDFRGPSSKMKSDSLIKSSNLSNKFNLFMVMALGVLMSLGLGKINRAFRLK